MIYLRFLLLSVVHVSLYAQSADPAASTEQSQLFKIGFEFQESHHMCPWAIEAPEIQSIPIFSVCQGDRVLWDLTIDWQDLEFVTMPITNNELDILKITMCSIQIACNALVELNEKANSNADVTFKKWVNYFAKLLQGHDDPTIKRLSIKQHPIYSLSLGSFKFPAPYGSRFNFEFQPQVTIQHHLESSINLCLGLLVEDITYQEDRGVIEVEKSGILKYFVQNNPLFSTENVHADSVSFQKRTTPQEGFLFLHMITCIDLTREKRPEVVPCGDLNISCSTEQTQTMCLLHFGGGQVNAKSSVNFLSRRPFSSMWRDIETNQSYAIFLTEKVKKEFLDALTTKFDQINYGEIFFTEEGKRMDLRQCDFAQQLQDPNIQFLLGQGTLSLEFIRTVDPYFLLNYFAQVVKSVSDQKFTQRCVFDKTTKTLKLIKTVHDILSPPHLTSEKDSMGAFKDDSKLDLKYGQAIVEFRGISNIPESAIKRINKLVNLEDDTAMKNNFLSQDFSLDVNIKTKRELKNEQYDLQTQAEGLFLYITALLTGRLS